VLASSGTRPAVALRGVTKVYGGRSRPVTALAG